MRFSTCSRAITDLCRIRLGTASSRTKDNARVLKILTMTEPNQAVGSVSWIDLTVPDADRIGAFYNAVAGWKMTPFDMSGYSDFCMETAEGKSVAGI